jgi:hypothetical protein
MTSGLGYATLDAIGFSRSVLSKSIHMGGTGKSEFACSSSNVIGLSESWRDGSNRLGSLEMSVMNRRASYSIKFSESWLGGPICMGRTGGNRSGASKYWTTGTSGWIVAIKELIEGESKNPGGGGRRNSERVMELPKVKTDNTPPINQTLDITKTSMADRMPKARTQEIIPNLRGHIDRAYLPI